jgi:hypothetical protein
MKDNPLYVELIDVAEVRSHGQPPDASWNGRLIMNPNGTVWVVMDGVARGYRSAELFDRVHGWSSLERECHFGPGGQICFDGRRPRRFHKIPCIDVNGVIQEGPPISYDSTIVCNRAGTMFFFEDNSLRGIPSPAVMEKYHFNWDTGKRNCYSDEIINRLRPAGIIA